ASSEQTGLERRICSGNPGQPPRRRRARPWQAAGMVLEVALIDVGPGQADAFAEAYAQARPIVATTPGCRSGRMTQGIETPSRFVLLVEWDSIEAHVVGFRGTERFGQWRGLIGRYLANSPMVEHFADID